MEKQYPKDTLDIAYTFAKRCHDECRDVVKAIVLFGSSARKKQGANDIDILVVIDDISLKLTPEIVQTYRVILGKIIADVSKSLHVTTLKLSSFWEYVRNGDPIAVNILRDGYPLLDTGFFNPLQVLLLQGRIKPTPESILTYQQRSVATLSNAKWHVLQAVTDLYWSVVDAAHAALMSIGQVPASPEHVADLIDDRLVKTKLVPATATNTMRKFYTLAKDIEHRKRSELSGASLDDLFKEAEEFVRFMKRIVEEN